MDEKSGRIRSTPGWSTSGNSTPQSTTSSLPSYSKTVMLRPMAPSPPSGMTRSAPVGQRAGGIPVDVRLAHARASSGSAAAALHRVARIRRRRHARRPSRAVGAQLASSAAVASTSGGRTGPPGRPSWFRPALTRMVPWVRKMPGEQRQQPPVQARAPRPRRPRSYASIICLVRGPGEVGRGADHADPADRQQRQRDGVVAAVDTPGRCGAVTHDESRHRSPLASLTATIRGCSASRTQRLGLDRRRRSGAGCRRA